VDGYIPIIVAVVIVVLILLRLTKGGMDRGRINSYIEAHGGRLIDASWRPFGPGWLGKHYDRIYKVRYLDKDGNHHHAYCKTSGWSGVYFTDDNIDQYAKAPEDQRSLEEENRRLHEELERLRHRQT
jgi:hypothetical protein